MSRTVGIKVHMTCNFNCLVELNDFSRSQAAMCTVNVVIYPKRWYYRALIGSDPWDSGNSDHLEWPARSFTYCKPFQMGFHVPLCSNWQDFNGHNASCGPSADWRKDVKHGAWWPPGEIADLRRTEIWDSVISGCTSSCSGDL